jgi:hypothetical protein
MLCTVVLEMMMHVAYLAASIQNMGRELEILAFI